MQRLFVVALTLSFSGYAFAFGGVGKGKGKGHGGSKDRDKNHPPVGRDHRGWENGRPPGWSKGEKTGWTTSLPPGLAKKDRNHPAVRKFLREIEDDERTLRDRARDRRISGERLERLLESFQISSRRGVPSNVARSALEVLLDYDPTTEEIEWTGKGLTYAVERGVTLSDISGVLKRKLIDRVRGAQLAESIYDEVDRLRGR